MILRFLGTGSAINSPYLRTAMILQSPHRAPLLLDASPECGVLLRRHGYAPHDLEAVILTHLHGDHMLGLPLLLTEFLIAPNTHPLRIIGPADTERVLRSLLQLSYPEGDPDTFLQNAGVVFEPVRGETPMAISDYRVQPVPARHGAIEAYGYRIETDALTLYCSGDGALTNDVARAVSESDFSVLNVATIDAPLPTHMNMRDAIGLAESGRRGQYFFVAHRSYAEPGEHSETLVFPLDGSAYELERGHAPRDLVQL
jgi:ribonuclease BN (tRNA processing enzyme)